MNLANVAFLLGAVALSLIGSLALWLHNRRPSSFGSSIDEFQREMHALGSEVDEPRRGRRLRRQRPEPIVPPRGSGVAGELRSAVRGDGRTGKGA